MENFGSSCRPLVATVGFVSLSCYFWWCRELVGSFLGRFPRVAKNACRKAGFQRVAGCYRGHGWLRGIRELSAAASRALEVLPGLFSRLVENIRSNFRPSGSQEFLVDFGGILAEFWWNSGGILAEIWRNSVEFCGILQNSAEFCRKLRNPNGICCGILDFWLIRIELCFLALDILFCALCVCHVRSLVET